MPVLMIPLVPLTTPPRVSTPSLSVTLIAASELRVSGTLIAWLPAALMAAMFAPLSRVRLPLPEAMMVVDTSPAKVIVPTVMAAAARSAVPVARVGRRSHWRRPRWARR